MSVGFVRSVWMMCWTMSAPIVVADLLRGPLDRLRTGRAITSSVSAQQAPKLSIGQSTWPRIGISQPPLAPFHPICDEPNYQGRCISRDADGPYSENLFFSGGHSRASQLRGARP